MLNELAEFKVVLGVIGADCHAVGNKIIASVLGPKGIEVENLGVMVSQDEFITAAIENGADAILVSSIYGHGEIDCQDFRTRCIQRGIGDIILYVGGNLVIGKRDFASVEAQFKEMGFDRVFKPSVSLDEVATLLKDDIRAKRPASYGHNSSAAWVPSLHYTLAQ
ncbi:methylaspartate mutase subunit S [Cochlodiniinecator piscidefendens]|uniref:methylaspartate mutase subunit S n=1 Tax=Cochlodiniinecator piscidefendens TaxID=2715756 RepID=UPI00140D1E1F|nr:methylaspartate mutase subunit S [Cochlodiniinecator piscidefendens]